MQLKNTSSECCIDSRSRYRITSKKATYQVIWTLVIFAFKSFTESSVSSCSCGYHRDTSATYHPSRSRHAQSLMSSIIRGELTMYGCGTTIHLDVRICILKLRISNNCRLNLNYFANSLFQENTHFRCQKY